MINYKLVTEQVLKPRDIQIVLELLKDRGIDAHFEDFEAIKVGTAISSFDDFERIYLPKSREERLKKEETIEQTGERLAKETIAKIGADLHKHKFPTRRKK